MNLAMPARPAPPTGFEAQTLAVLDALHRLGPRPLRSVPRDDLRREPTLADAVRLVLWEEGSDLSPEPVGAAEAVVIQGPGASQGPGTTEGAGGPGALTLGLTWPLGYEDGLLPVIVFVHGGWVRSGVDAAEASIRALANRTGCIVVAVDYRQPPAHPFPAAHDDVLAAVAWTRSAIGEFGGDRDRLALAAEGHGAGMAVTACLARPEPSTPPPRFLLLVDPVVDHEGRGWPSASEHAGSPALDLEAFEEVTELAFADPLDRRDVRASPLQAATSALAGMPPTLVVTAASDLVRDQGEAFGRRLIEAGVDATVMRADGVGHGYLATNPVVERAQEVVSIAARFLRGALDLPGEAAPARPPDLAQVLMADHRAIRLLLRSLETGRPAEKGLVLAQLTEVLGAHEQLERELLYPEVATLAGAEAVEESLAEHRDLAEALELLAGTTPGGPAGSEAGDMLGLVIASAHEHMAEEEAELLPRLLASLGPERMRDLGRRALAWRQAEATRRGPRPTYAPGAREPAHP